MAKERIPEEARSRQLQYYYDHREERLAYGSEYARKNKKTMTGNARRYRKNNREKVQAYQEAYYQANKEAIRARRHEYYLTHKMEHQAYNRAWYAKKKAAAGGWSSDDGKEKGCTDSISGEKGNVK